MTTLASLRLARHITQSELANHAGVSLRTIARGEQAGGWSMQAVLIARVLSSLHRIRPLSPEEISDCERMTGIDRGAFAPDHAPVTEAVDAAHKAVPASLVAMLAEALNYYDAAFLAHQLHTLITLGRATPRTPTTGSTAPQMGRTPQYARPAQDPPVIIWRAPPKIIEDREVTVVRGVPTETPSHADRAHQPSTSTDAGQPTPHRAPTKRRKRA